VHVKHVDRGFIASYSGFTSHHVDTSDHDSTSVCSSLPFLGVVFPTDCSNRKTERDKELSKPSPLSCGASVYISSQNPFESSINADYLISLSPNTKRGQLPRLFHDAQASILVLAGWAFPEYVPA
jgi:hypothetical protein